MKLVIQIPCFNEQESILEVLTNIPKKIKGIDEIEINLLDDGSEDDTVKIAKDFGIKNIISSNKNQGLSYNFIVGINNAIEQNCDILVNLDGDNQYNSCDIEKLIEPILNKKADIVVGTRPIDKIKTFSKTKKLLQKIGTFITKLITGIEIKDATSGFRAYSKKALLHLNIFNPFTYTLESLIQANIKKLIVENVEIRVNPQINRKSKLFKSDFIYIYKQARTLIRYFIIYRPCRFFMSFSIIFFFVSLIIGFRFLYFYFNHLGTGHIQSLILCSILSFIAFTFFVLAIISDLLSINRKLLENIQYEIRLSKYKK